MLGTVVNTNTIKHSRSWTNRQLTKVTFSSESGKSDYLKAEEEEGPTRLQTVIGQQKRKNMTKKIKEDNADAAITEVSEEIESQGQIPLPTRKKPRASVEMESKKEKLPAKRPATKKAKTASNISSSSTRAIVKPKEEDSEQTCRGEPKSTPTKKRSNNNNSKIEQCITECDQLPKLWDPSCTTNLFKILSWNVNGIRALLKNYPEALVDLANEHRPDLICLQETKLQESHVMDPKLELKGVLLEKEGYDSYWSCSKTKKGYSGTAVFLKRNDNKTTSFNTSGTGKQQQKKLQSFFKKKKVEATTQDEATTEAQSEVNEQRGESSQPSSNSLFTPLNISYGLGNDSGDPEGRCITIDYHMFTIINIYVPNSGDGLVRLDYRTKEWDVELRKVMKDIEKTRGLPVILVGDLNVGS